MLRPADRLSYDRAIVTQPVWNRFNTASEAMGVEDHVLLHAGPPFNAVKQIPYPIMNSACVAAVWAGLSKDFDQAQAMIEAGEILLKPAQDYDVVTPLAAVVSAHMPLHTVYDAWRGQHRIFTPINGGSRPSLRLGLRSEAVLDHLNWLNSKFLDVLEAGLGEGIALVPLAVHGLIGGDDCHGRTPVATQALIEELTWRTPKGICDEAVLEFMATSPSLFLNLWMAATKLMMKAATGIENSSFVVAAGGNGKEVGIQISGIPNTWFTVPASPPSGVLEAGLPKDRALGAIGDSAVVEAFGLGTMAIDVSPEQRKALEKFLPDNAAARFSGLSIDAHPCFNTLNLQLGSTARAVVELGFGPVIGLGILDRLGEHGRLGAGIYDMPVEPFANALQELDGRASQAM